MKLKKHGKRNNSKTNSTMKDHFQKRYKLKSINFYKNKACLKMKFYCEELEEEN